MEENKEPIRLSTWIIVGMAVIFIAGSFVYYLYSGYQQRKLASEEINRKQQELLSEQQKQLEQAKEEIDDLISINKIPQEKVNESNNPTSSSLLTKIRCQEIGEKQYKDLVNKFGSSLVFNPEYTYNKRLDTCLYSGGYFGGNGADYMTMFVRDTISNKDILFYMARFENGEFIRLDIPGNSQSIPDFNQKKDLLFNE